MLTLLLDYPPRFVAGEIATSLAFALFIGVQVVAMAERSPPFCSSVYGPSTVSQRGDKPAHVAALRLTHWARLVGLSSYAHGAALAWRGHRQIEGLWMRLPFFHPSRDEIAATATDLITRFGLGAHAEASRLAQVSAQKRSRRDRVLYEVVGREIDASFAEAQRRLVHRFHETASIASWPR